MRHRGALHERQGSDQDHAGVRETRVRAEGDDLVGVDFQAHRSRLVALVDYESLYIKGPVPFAPREKRCLPAQSSSMHA